MFGVRAAAICAMLVVGVALAVAIPRGSAAPLIITRHYTPADRVSERYQYVPIDVPSALGTLRIADQYDRSNGENVVDLGLFEPGPVRSRCSRAPRSARLLGPGAPQRDRELPPLPRGTHVVFHDAVPSITLTKPFSPLTTASTRR